jgi:hypothetical protein
MERLPLNIAQIECLPSVQDCLPLGQLEPMVELHHVLEKDHTAVTDPKIEKHCVATTPLRGH